MILVVTLDMCSANRAWTCLSSSIDSRKGESTRYTVLPSRLSSRGAPDLRVISGGYPIGLRTVSLTSLLRSGAIMGCHSFVHEENLWVGSSAPGGLAPR